LTSSFVLSSSKPYTLIWSTSTPHFILDTDKKQKTTRGENA